VYSDTVIDAVRGRLAGWGIRCDNEGFVAGATKVLQRPDYRVADAVDVREKGLGDNRYAHTTTVAASNVDMVTDGDTVCKL
jgi:hypothetical protein